MAGTLQTAMGRRGFGFLLVMALLGGFPLPAPAARPDPVELRSGTGSVGRLPRVVVDDGGSYVAAEKLTALLKGSWSAKGSRATLTVGKRSAQFVRDQPRVVVQGQTITLDAAVRMGSGTWLIPEDFLVKGLPKLAPGIAAVPRAEEAAGGEAGPGRRRPRGAALSLLSLLHAHRHRDRRAPSPTRWSRGARRCACACPACRSPAPASRRSATGW